jgi:hypothetical protein
MIELLWTLIGIPTKYVTSVFINDAHGIIYNTTIPKSFKYGTISIITLFSYLRCSTENDLVTNISNILNNTIEYQC